jgi:transcriptional regulator with XRE-family HTH domain
MSATRKTRTPPIETTGDYLRRLREAAGLTCSQVGHALGLSKSAVSLWENDRSVPEARRLPELARLYGVGHAALASRIHRPPIGRPVKTEIERDHTIRFGKRLRSLRQRRELSVPELAARAGLRTASIWAWERGAVYPQASSLRRLASALGMNVAELEGKR